ncbi:dienelactone hydrolase family protein [Sphingobacterium rhinopitheci]|uniref:dienelactone hydrolase family protein n=1 Tax=Sphingobacterium rhinopitheci TaxID=2781960 RepID=UPI001F52A0AC|nr:dienelactone hydrolase family protein [Sphingobacterium rhinopitheci]MCI0921919.1 dienelactone hydrolase family protein [Sphingobacterium rhinopitheci]
MKNIVILLSLVLCSTIGSGQQLKPVQYTDGSQKLKGLITSNAAQKNLPAVLILPAWKGIDNEARTTAINLAKLGYVAFIADIYGEGNIPVDNAAASKLAGTYKSDYKAYQHRIQLALQELLKAGVDKDKIAVIGYCFGGTGALEVARAGFEVQAAVSIHGGLAKAADRPNKEIKTKVLVQHPADDKSVSAADLDNLEKELKEGNADFQIITYAKSGHTFTNPESSDFNPLMAERAWKHLVLFLDEVLK